MVALGLSFANDVLLGQPPAQHRHIEEKHPHLSTSQRAAVEQILTSHDRITGLEGVAGAGKTPSLAAVHADDIDFQIESDILGMIAPGMTQDHSRAKASTHRPSATLPSGMTSKSPRLLGDMVDDCFQLNPLQCVRTAGMSASRPPASTKSGMDHEEYEE